MGKRLIQQARGKGGPTYRSPSFRFKGAISYAPMTSETVEGMVVDLVKCQGHSSPLIVVEYFDGSSALLAAPENVRVGEEVAMGPEAEVKTGNVLPLANIPEGTPIYNIEHIPGDGGKFVRSSGTAARVLSTVKEGVIVELPSKKKKTFNGKCRASIGVIAGGGRVDKPMVKAGNSFYKFKAKNKLWPVVSGNAQNAVDHPFGNSRSLRKSKAKPAPKNAPPGRKVGMVRPKHTGRNR